MWTIFTYGILLSRFGIIKLDRRFLSGFADPQGVPKIGLDTFLRKCDLKNYWLSLKGFNFRNLTFRRADGATVKTSDTTSSDSNLSATSSAATKVSRDTNKKTVLSILKLSRQKLDLVVLSLKIEHQ